MAIRRADNGHAYRQMSVRPFSDIGGGHAQTLSARVSAHFVRTTQTQVPHLPASLRSSISAFLARRIARAVDAGLLSLTNPISQDLVHKSSVTQRVAGGIFSQAGGICPWRAIASGSRSRASARDQTNDLPPPARYRDLPRPHAYLLNHPIASVH